MKNTRRMRIKKQTKYENMPVNAKQEVNYLQPKSAAVFRRVDPPDRDDTAIAVTPPMASLPTPRDQQLDVITFPDYFAVYFDRRRANSRDRINATNHFINARDKRSVRVLCLLHSSSSRSEGRPFASKRTRTVCIRIDGINVEKAVASMYG
jgi:hypothetical protein